MKNKQTLKRTVEKLSEKRNKLASELTEKELSSESIRFGKLSGIPLKQFLISNKSDGPELNHYISIIEEDIRILRKTLDAKRVECGNNAWDVQKLA